MKKSNHLILKKQYSIIFIAIGLFICLIAILFTFITTKPQSNSKSKILVTFTDLNYWSNCFYIDSDNNCKLLYKQPKSDFDTFSLSDKYHCLYYNKRNLNNKIGIFKFDMITKTEILVTDNIINSDFMCCDDSIDQLFARVVQNNHRNFQILCLNYKYNSYKILNSEDYDESIRAFSYDQVSKHLLIATYSTKEQYDKINMANQEHKPSINLNINLAIYDLDGNKLKTVCTTDKQVESISIDHKCKAALISVGTNGNINAQRSVYMLDINSGELKDILPASDIYNNFSYAQFSNDNNGIYLLANKINSDKIADNSGRIFKKKFLIFYNLKTKKYSEILEKSDGIINYFSIIS